jgi:hypothetical protein
MTLVVEDGNGLPTANAYVDVAFADDYFTLRGIVAWVNAVSTAKEVALVKATDYIDLAWGPRFKGVRAFVSSPPDETVDQALEFPRDVREPFIGNIDYLDINFATVNSYTTMAPLTKPVAIPSALKKACCEYALRALQAGALLVDPEVDPSGLQVQQKTENVGPIQTTTIYYNIGGITITQPYPSADLLLTSLIKPKGQVIRG